MFDLISVKEIWYTANFQLVYRYLNKIINPSFTQPTFTI